MPTEISRTRATSENEKAERRALILDAAEALLANAQNRESVMADVAQAAGLAKGTVYLYFPSKEELLLALHERHVQTFFEALIAKLDAATPITQVDVLAVTATHILRHPTYLTCASVCMGAMERSIPPAATHAHMAKAATWMERAGSGLERHFPALPPGDGVSLLRASYAMILGLWQLLKPDTPGHAHNLPTDAATTRVFRGEFALEVERSLLSLWSGRLASLP